VGLLAHIAALAISSSATLEIYGNMADEAAGSPPPAPVVETKIEVPVPPDGGGVDSNVPVTVTPATDDKPITVTPVVK
jgi:hypothetical protein